MPKTYIAGRFALALAIGACGGAIFAWLNVPLAWMLGSLIACTIAAISGAPVATPGWARPPIVIIIGLMLGSSFSPAILEGLMSWSFTIGGLVAYLVGGGFLCVGYLRRIAGYDIATALYSAMPGGLTEMILLGEQNGGDVRIIALSHSLRILIVVSALPLIMAAIGLSALPPRQDVSFQISWSGVGFGWAVFSAVAGIALGQILRLPAKFLFGPMLVSALVHMVGLTDFTPPIPLVNFAQIGLGVAIGCRFRNADMRMFMPVFLHTIVITVILLTLTVAFSVSLGIYTGLSILQIMLSYAPGGLTEMGLIAVALHLDVAFVTTHHLLRILLIIGGAQMATSLWTRRKRARSGCD